MAGANGGVYMRFKRSIGPLESFTLRTRIVGCDDKWLWIEQRFLTADGRCKACALTKVLLRIPVSSSSSSSSFLSPIDALQQALGTAHLEIPPFEPGNLITGSIEPQFGRDLVA